MLSISANILVKNGAKTIEACLESLVDFEEVVILDNGSTDGTLEKARRFPNVKIFEHKFIGFGPLKNLAVDHSSNDWIFSIDSDEVLTEGLLEEIKGLVLDEETVYGVKRENFYRGKLIKCCGWYPDYVKRLFNRKHVRFNEKLVHESLAAKGRIVKLGGALRHYPFNSPRDFIDKMQIYSTLYASESTKRVSPFMAFIKTCFCFFRNYFLLKGFLYGYEGLLISFSNSCGVFYKYVKLYESKFDNNDV
jgi:glycosyltransferase involved in cell wall biosynthesis